MGGSSKFSLSLSRRRPRPQKDAVVGTPVPPSSSTLSKAERLLGTSGLAIKPPSRLPPPPQLQLQLQHSASRSSYRSFTMSESSVADFSDEESPSIKNDDNHPPRVRTLHRQASSDVLGEPHEDNGYTVSMTSRTTAQLRPQMSSSTLKSYYDAKKFPLAISQQTSDSAIRDMALRKGKPPVVGTSPSVTEEDIPEDEQESEESSRKRKPGRPDFSRLFSKPSFSSLHLLSSSKYAESTSQLSVSTDFSPIHVSALRSMTSISSIGQNYKSGNKLSKSRPGDPTPPSKLGEPRSVPSRDDIAIFKSHVRRPPRGVQHWFDGLLEEDDEFDSGDESIQNQPLSVQNHQKEHDVDVAISQSLQPNLLSSRQLPQASTSSTHRMSLKSQHSTTSSSGVARPNLRESIISSSTPSSDDDDNDPHLSQPRDSIAISEIGETILIGKAQAFEVKPLRKLVQEQNAQRRTSISSSMSNMTASSKPSSIGSGAHIVVPAQARIKMTRLDRRPSSIPEDGDENSTSPRSHTPHSSSSSTRTFQGEGHKLMAVTAEEEALLEMMRRKRAAMAKHSFAEGYKTALQQETKRAGTPSRQRRPVGQSSLGNAPVLHNSKRPPSLIDNFPISNVQRSSLILAASLPSPPPTSALPDPPIDPPSKRHSRLSQYTTLSAMSASSANAKRQSQISSTSSTSIHGRAGSGALPNTKPSTSLSPLTVDVSSITPSARDTDSQTTSSGSQASPLSSPVTPQTQCDSTDDTVIIKPSSSTRDSSPSSIKLDSPDRLLLDEAHLLTATEGKCCNHNHQLAASSSAKIMPAHELPRPATAPQLHSENRIGKGTPLRTSASTLRREICVDRSSWRQSTFGPLTRCSVSEDVLAAWTDLGGWRGFGYYGVAGTDHKMS